MEEQLLCFVTDNYVVFFSLSLSKDGFIDIRIKPLTSHSTSL